MDTTQKPSSFATFFEDAAGAVRRIAKEYLTAPGTNRAIPSRMSYVPTTFPKLEADTAVLWAGHPGVYLILDRTQYSALLREWGNAESATLWTMMEELTPITKDEAVAMMMNHERNL
jgi:hypothetical protein